MKRIIIFAILLIIITFGLTLTRRIFKYPDANQNGMTAIEIEAYGTPSQGLTNRQ
jgi:hypothetical protein